jgi:hypothetical protein
VGRDLDNADLGGKLLDDVPDELLRHSFAPHLASATHTAEEAATGNSSGFHPIVQETLHPIREGDSSNVPSLPAVYDRPMSFALLKMTYGQPGEFVATEPTSKKHGKQGPIPFALHPIAVWGLPESLALVGS